MFAVIMVTEDSESGGRDISHVATVRTEEDAQHFIQTCLGDNAIGGYFEIGTEEWVHPMFAELAAVDHEEDAP